MEATKSTRSQPTRIVGLDFGLARIGIAVSDERKIIATPLVTLKAERKVEQTVGKLMQQLEAHQKEYSYQIEEIVIGLPLLMSGKMGFLADEVKIFIEALKQITSIPIITWDERLTSVQAERSLRESSLTRKKRSSLIDAVAAVIILQNYLDSKIREII